MKTILIANSQGYFGAKTFTEYEVISSDQRHFIIKSCVQSATYRNEFPNSVDQYLATFSNQTFTFSQQSDHLSIDTKTIIFKTIVEPWRPQVLQLEEEDLIMTSEQIVSTVSSPK